MAPTHSKETGLRLSKSLDQLLEVLPGQVDQKLAEATSRCFGRGHPLPEETSTSGTAALIKDFADQIRKDPSRRHFVVDRESLVTDDAGWLVAARCALPNSSLQWAITTVRSLERCVYHNCYETEWKIQHATGPRGSAVVTKRSTGDPNTCHQAFFSDMPKCVAATGKQLGKLHPSQIIVRVLRTAPRSSLNDRLTRFLQQPLPENVFTLWIRHHESIADLPGLGKYRYKTIDGDKHPVLELLTDIIEEKEGANLATSPLAHDFMQASQAPPQRCRRPQSDNPKFAPVTAVAPDTRSFTFDVKPQGDGNPFRYAAEIVAVERGETPVKTASSSESIETSNKSNPEILSSSVTAREADPLLTTTEEQSLSASADDEAKVADAVVDMGILSTGSSLEEASTTEDTTAENPNDKVVASEPFESTDIGDALTDSEIAEVDPHVIPDDEVVIHKFTTIDGKDGDVVYCAENKQARLHSKVDTRTLGESTENNGSPVVEFGELEADKTTQEDKTAVSHAEDAKPDSATAVEENAFTTPLKKTVDATEEVRSNSSRALSLLGTPENPTTLTLDPMGLAMAVVSASNEVHTPLDTQYDDLEVSPTFTFDEEDLTPGKVSKSKGYGALTPSTEIKDQTETEVASESNARNGGVTSIVNSRLESSSRMEQETAGEITSLSNLSEPSTVPSSNSEIVATAEKRQTKKVRCVGCGMKKPKADFSNSQLKKKKNNRCLYCVRANCLGPANNN